MFLPGLEKRVSDIFVGLGAYIMVILCSLAKTAGLFVLPSFLKIQMQLLFLINVLFCKLWTRELVHNLFHIGPKFISDNHVTH